MSLQTGLAHAAPLQTAEQKAPVVVVVRRPLEDDPRGDGGADILEPDRAVAEDVRGAEVAEAHHLQGAEHHHRVAEQRDGVDVAEPGRPLLL